MERLEERTVLSTLAPGTDGLLSIHHDDDMPSAHSGPGSAPSAAPAVTQVLQNHRWEASLTSSRTYANPFNDVNLSVRYTKPGAAPLTGHGFWDGGSTFKIRMAFPEPGIWRFQTTASDPTDTGLHHRKGRIQVLPYADDNPLYRHGFLRPSASRRSLEHADGTPFLWVGDTLWGATVWLSEQGFRTAIDDRRGKHFTVLQTNFARKNEVDTIGDTPWSGDRWNVRFLQKVDRMFDHANDAGMYLFVNGLIDLKWDRRIAQYRRLVEMIAIRYGAHHLSFSSSMDDPYSPEQDEINNLLDGTGTRALLTQHPGSALDGSGNVGTALRYYDLPYMDYVMNATGVEGNLEAAARNAIDWMLRLYNHVPPKPVNNGEAWYEGLNGGTARIAAHLGYLSLLSGGFGYTYGTALWNARDADLPRWRAFEGSFWMQGSTTFSAPSTAAGPSCPGTTCSATSRPATRIDVRLPFPRAAPSTWGSRRSAVPSRST